MKLIIAGGRHFGDKELLEKTLALHVFDVKEVVCGGARGADQLGKEWAESLSIPVKMFPADWDRLGRRAGYVRNAQMADYATHCLCFWDGESKGTKHMIDLARKKGIKLKVVRY